MTVVDCGPKFTAISTDGAGAYSHMGGLRDGGPRRRAALAARDPGGWTSVGRPLIRRTALTTGSSRRVRPQGRARITLGPSDPRGVRAGEPGLRGNRPDIMHDHQDSPVTRRAWN
jgi:hypothetical protein